MNQRWSERKAKYRPSGEVIRTSQYDVEPIPDDTTAKQFVLRHHYSGSYPAARRRHGLYRHGELVGVAVFSVPCNDRALSVFQDPKRSVELGRFVLTDEVPGNGETWFLARCFELLRREEFAGVLSFSDPTPRTTLSGETVFPGHVGTIYQAHNARFLGRSTSRKLLLLPDGRAFSPRAASKVRALERGWQHSVRLLQSFGAGQFTEDSPDEWLRFWLPQISRQFRHPGNLRYAWGLTKKESRRLPVGGCYPKRAS